jgi:hypothetical protein
VFLLEVDVAQGTACGKASSTKFKSIVGGQHVGCYTSNLIISESVFSGFGYPSVGHFFGSRAFVRDSRDLASLYSKFIVTPTTSQKIVSRRVHSPIEADSVISLTSSNAPIPIPSFILAIAKRFGHADMT